MKNISHLIRDWRFVTILFLVLALLIMGALFARHTLFGNKPERSEVETQISRYIQERNLNIPLHTPEYKIFLRDILLGEHPDLTNGADGAAIQQYTLEYLDIKPDADALEQVRIKSNKELPSEKK